MQIISRFTQLANNYLNSLDTAPVFPTPEAIADLAHFDTPLQDEPADPVQVLDILDAYGSPATVRSAGGRYYGFVIGSSVPAALGANLMTAIWDQNAAMHVSSPVSAALEKVAGKWLIDLFNFPADSGFGFVTGDTMANFTALAAARNHLLKNEGWDVEAKGLFGAPEITVIVGGEVHVSVLNALSMLGFGRERIIKVPADRQGRMVVSQIPIMDEPTIICTQAGNVNSGAFDDTETVCRIKGKNTWVHVDAAFGLWAAVSADKSYLTKGIEQADSWATDAHKWLNAPYDSGLVFVRHKAALFASMSGVAAAYLPADDAREPFQFVPEMSRQARGVPVWAALKSLGKQGLAEMVDRHCRQARRFAEGLAAAGFEILNDVVLNQVLVHLGDQAATTAALARLQAEGTCWCGGTVWQSKPAIRISVSGWNSTDEDVERSLEAMVRCLREG